MMRYRALARFGLVAGCFGWLAAVVAADEGPRSGPVVMDTDLGLDDVVALALALQDPSLEIAAVVSGAGAMSADSATMYAERLLHYFNRSDVALYAPCAPGAARTPAERFVRPALPEEVPLARQAFAPAAYKSPRGPTTVVALGPLTNLAAALAAQPDLKDHILRVVVPGLPDPRQNWNLQADPSAYDTVRAAGLTLHFIVPADQAAKPAGWKLGTDDYGPGTSLGETLVRKLLADADARKHYLEMLTELTDELAVMYTSQPTLFLRVGDARDVFIPTGRDALLAALREKLVEGRQVRPRVLFVEGLLPESAYKPEIRALRARILAKNGPTEWFAQVLLNELHQHVGAWSIVGVKMGLRAAELLNAPQHDMTIISHTDAVPPRSCMNDGLIIATGSTPGRALFTLGPPPPQSDARATFTYNGRSITLRLKSEYQAQIGRRIRELLEHHTLDDDAYWLGVKALALDVWENWHRRDIFEVSERPSDAADSPR